MQSSHSPELSSDYSPFSQNTGSTENCSGNTRKKQISPKSRRSPSKPASATPTSDERESPLKRKLNCYEKIPEISVDKLKRTNGNIDSILVNANNSERLNDAVDSMDCATARKKFSYNSKSYYSAMLNLTPQTGSIEEGQKLFGVLIKPIQVSMFMDKYWERKPIHVDRNCPDFYKDLLSIDTIDKMLRENHVEFTKHIDIMHYQNGVSEIINPIGRAKPTCVWNYFGEGYSVCLLNPQTLLPSIHSMNATLQEYFQCITAASAYITPPNSEGYLPHYDGVETFILQIEGKKRWHIYEPASRNEMLPRESKNIDMNKTNKSKPYLDVVLKAGDLLYFPRGFSHQTFSVEDCLSLHIVLTVYQKQTFGDLLAILIPKALKEAINTNVNLRRGLPLNIWQNMGLVNSDNYYPERDAIITQIKACFETVCSHVKADCNLDNAVDQMALRYQNFALPPKLTPDEEIRSVSGCKGNVTEDGYVECPFIESNTKIRLIRGNVLRMVRHDDEIRVYYSSENSKEYQGFEENNIIVAPEDAPAVEVLIKAYPSFVTPDQLQLEDDDKNVSIAQLLWEKGCLMTEEPL